MKVIKNINNNVSICLDNKGNEVIAFGKGVGFKTPPYELTDLSIITKTFYDVNPRYFGLLNLISEEIFELSAKIVDYACLKITAPLNPNVVFTLADHIQFAIQRYEQGLVLKFTSQHDLKHFNPMEVAVGEYAVQLVRKTLDIHFPKDEIYSIAMHMINAESIEKGTAGRITADKVILDVLLIIENFFNLTIDRKGFNYSRFASHLEYLLERSTSDTALSSKNLEMYHSIKKNFPKTYECAKEIDAFFETQFSFKLEEEELIYLMLHINRLCTREDSTN
uniref:PRD domain-containing protein n=1 Tax=Candidatus Enterococcus willemsii TaxID=1857215 RepID=UPI00403F4F76